MDILEKFYPVLFLIASILAGIASYMAFGSKKTSKRHTSLGYAAISVVQLCLFLIFVIPPKFFGSWAKMVWLVLISIAVIGVIIIIDSLIIDFVVTQKRTKKKGNSRKTQ